MYTDPNHIKVEDPGDTKNNTVFIYLSAFAKAEHFEKYLPEYKNLDELKAHYERGGLGDMKVKRFLNDILQELLAPIRARRQEFEKQIPEIYKTLEEGSIKANKIVSETVEKVKDAMGINYFKDKNLIEGHYQKYINKDN
jgi:tryptophanyl-tRNA synthetase